MLLDNLKKCDLLPGFQYGFRFSCSTEDLVTLVSDRITRVFNRSK